MPFTPTRWLKKLGGTLTGLLQFSGTTHAGIKLNALTTVQRDALTASNGMLIYNTTTARLEMYQGGAWVNYAKLVGDTMTGLLQWSGTGHAGLQLNSLTTAQRNALTPANGMLIYNTTTSKVQQYIGGAWADVSSGGSGLTNWTESALTYGGAEFAKFTPSSAVANVSVILAPKGTGAVMVDTPDGTSAGGNSRGIFAVDLQHSRGDASEVASGGVSFLGGGDRNTASGERSVVCGGFKNTASGSDATVIGGTGNFASSVASSVLGGVGNAAMGYASVAAGYRAQANAAGAFSFADVQDFDSTNNTENSWRSRFAGGYQFTGGAATFAGQILSSVLTANCALATDASKGLVSSATTATELGYVSGVTSAIQTQLDTKPTVVTRTDSLDFGNILAGASADLTITVPGASVGNAVILGPPADPDASLIFMAFVSAADTVTVRAYNVGSLAVDQAAKTFRATVLT